MGARTQNFVYGISVKDNYEALHIYLTSDKLKSGNAQKYFDYIKEATSEEDILVRDAEFKRKVIGEIKEGDLSDRFKDPTKQKDNMRDAIPKMEPEMYDNFRDVERITREAIKERREAAEEEAKKQRKEVARKGGSKTKIDTEEEINERLETATKMDLPVEIRERAYKDLKNIKDAPQDVESAVDERERLIDKFKIEARENILSTFTEEDLMLLADRLEERRNELGIGRMRASSIYGKLWIQRFKELKE